MIEDLKIELSVEKSTNSELSKGLTSTKDELNSSQKLILAENETLSRKLTNIKKDIDDHWCFIQPKPSRGGDAVVEFQVKARLELEGVVWCLIQVTEQVDEDVESITDSDLKVDGNNFTRKLNKKYFWSPQTTYLTKLSVYTNVSQISEETIASFPPLLERAIEKRLKEKFDRNWNEAIASYQNSLTEMVFK